MRPPGKLIPPTGVQLQPAASTPTWDSIRAGSLLPKAAVPYLNNTGYTRLTLCHPLSVSLPVVFRGLADNDVHEIQAWYEARQPGLGTRTRASLDFVVAIMNRMATTFARITVNPEVCTGKPCIRGLRFPVSRLLGLLAAGQTREEILKAYPYLESPDIDEALAYAASLAEDETVEIVTG